MGNNYSSFEAGMHLLLRQTKEAPYLSMKEIISILTGKARLLILILLSLPFCQPLIVPGFSMPCGLIVIFMGARMAFNKPVWLPKWILKREISSKHIQKFAMSALFLIGKMSRYIHPRLHWICLSPIMKIANGIMIALLGFFLALPIQIPLTNIIAAWGIFLLSLGLLKDDGVLVLIGYFIALFWVSLVFFVIWEITKLF